MTPPGPLPRLEWPSSVAPSALSDRELHVWAVALAAETNASFDLGQRLTPDEQQAAERFGREEPQTAYVVTRAALRTVLARLLRTNPRDVSLEQGANGKPRLAAVAGDLPLQFNVAHTPGLALLAVARNVEVGVDVERLRSVRKIEEIAHRYFTADEFEVIRSAAPTRWNAVFLSYWTRKEAILKAIGLGLQYPLDSFSLPEGDERPVLVTLPAWQEFAGTKLSVQPLRPAEDYVGAVATTGQPLQCCCRTLQF